MGMDTPLRNVIYSIALILLYLYTFIIRPAAALSNACPVFPSIQVFYILQLLRSNAVRQNPPALERRRVCHIHMYHLSDYAPNILPTMMPK